MFLHPAVGWGCWDLVAHPVMQVIGEQALVDILDLSEIAWTCWGVSTPRSGLGLRMVKELDLQLALGMNKRTDPKLNLSVQIC